MSVDRVPKPFPASNGRLIGDQDVQMYGACERSTSQTLRMLAEAERFKAWAVTVGLLPL